MRSWWDLGEGIGYDTAADGLAVYMIECPFCEEVGQFEAEHHAEKKKPNDEKVLNFDTLKCTNCSGYVMVLWSASSSFGSHRLHNFRVLPYPLKITKSPSYMPDGVGRSWLQAQKSLETSSWDAAAVMTRTAMETALKDNHAQGSRLVNKIDDLANKGILPPLMKDWAHEVRLLGNEGTHADPLSTGVEEEDAQDAAEFLDYLLEYLYALPKRIEEYRKRKSKP